MSRKFIERALQHDFENTAILNNATYMDYYTRMRILALSMFEWENLPDTMNARFLEQTLYDYGICGVAYDENLGLINLNCIPSSTLNIYNESVSYSLYGTNYATKTFDRGDIVLVYNNLDMFPTSRTISLFARRLYEAERTIDVNIKAQKTPILIKCSEKQRLTMKNLYKDYDGNTPVIFGSKDLDIEGVGVLKTDAPFVADKVNEYKKIVWCEFLSFLGINNVETEKKERLITDEVNANNQVIDLSAQTMLLTRQQACEEINKMFNLNVSVHMRELDKYNNENSENEVDEYEDEEVEEGEEVE